MLVWQGYGWIAIALLGVAGGLIKFGPQGDSEHLWSSIVWLGISTGLFFIDRRLHRISQQNTRVLIDPATGQNVVLKQAHSFMFMPLFAWVWIFATVGLYSGYVAITTTHWQ